MVLERLNCRDILVRMAEALPRRKYLWCCLKTAHRHRGHNWVGNLSPCHDDQARNGSTCSRTRTLLCSIVFKLKTIKLIKRLDGEVVLAEQPFDWQYSTPNEIRLDVQDNNIRALINGNVLSTMDDPTQSLTGGGIALVCEEGRIGTDSVSVLGNRG